MLPQLCSSFVAGLASVLLSLGLVLPQVAVAQAPFYQDKQLVIVINFARGGPTDEESRLLARHLGKHIVGNPAVIVKDMGKSGGTLGPDWLANTASTDGLSLGYFTGATARATLGEPASRADLARLAFVAAASGINVTYARSDIGGGIRKPADLLTRRDFFVGGVAPDNDRDVRLRMQLDLLGARYQYFTGFASGADARLALQRGEIQVFAESLLSYRTGIEPGMVANGAALPLWFDPLDDGDGFSRSPDADGIPALTYTDFLVKTRGELPSTELFQAWRLVNQAATRFLRILVMAPGTPKAAVTAVQQGVALLAQDAEFKEDSLKSIKFVLQFSADERTAERFQQVVVPEPRLQTVLRAYIDKVTADAPRTTVPP